MIQQQIPVIGTLAVDWVVFSEAMRKMHEAKVASTSVVAPSSAYFPTTSTIMPDQTQNARDLVMPMAKKLAAEGIKEADIVLLTIKTPAFFDIARTIGFKEGVKSPEVQAVCKLNIVAEKPVAAGVEEAQAATAAALQQYPKAHVIAALGHWYAGASAAIRDAGRKDVWVIAFDLDKGTAADLLTGGWPVYATYSLPIAQTGRADANVMGKILLGKRVPLIVKTVGTVTTPDNVAQILGRQLGRRENSVLSDRRPHGAPTDWKSDRAATGGPICSPPRPGRSVTPRGNRLLSIEFDCRHGASSNLHAARDERHRFDRRRKSPSRSPRSVEILRRRSRPDRRATHAAARHRPRGRRAQRRRQIDADENHQRRAAAEWRRYDSRRRGDAFRQPSRRSRARRLDGASGTQHS